jgi:hypothetical protein
MSETKAVPLSGYAILGVHAISQEISVVRPPEGEDDGGDFSFAWDWKFVNSKEVFDVLIRVGLTPTKARPYSAAVGLVGRFQQMEKNPSVAIDDFVTMQAVAILLPYARNYLATLSQSTRYGAFHLPTLNVAVLMADMAPSEATGAKQLRDGLVSATTANKPVAEAISESSAP